MYLTARVCCNDLPRGVFAVRAARDGGRADDAVPARGDGEPGRRGRGAHARAQDDVDGRGAALRAGAKGARACDAAARVRGLFFRGAREREPRAALLGGRGGRRGSRAVAAAWEWDGVGGVEGVDIDI